MRDGPRRFPQGSTCPVVLGYRFQEVIIVFAYRAITFYGGPFQGPSTNEMICNFPTPIQGSPNRTHDTDPATPVCLTHDRFRLFRFRSPLLPESRLLSFPGGTEMVHFPPFAPPFLCIQKEVTGHDSRRVSPFGHPRLSMQQLTEAYRSLRRPSSPPNAKASTVRP